MPKVQKVVRYKVVKNGHTTLFKKKTAARKRAHGESNPVRHHKRRRHIV